MECEFQVYCFGALRPWPRCPMPLSLGLFVGKDERMKASAAKPGVRMSREGARWASGRCGDPSIDHRNRTKRALRGTARGAWKRQGQSMHSSRLEGWTVDCERPQSLISRVEKSASQ